MPYRTLDHIKGYVPTPWKAAIKASFLKYAIWQRGVPPDFLIIGVMKGGTTSLYNYLVQHPQIFPALGKEIWYLSGSRWANGEAWYRRHFLTERRRRRLERRLGARVLTGEASADSLASPLAAERARSLNPNIRAIALLRDPVRRAVSQYRFLRQLGVEFPGTFDDVVRSQMKELRGRTPDLQLLMERDVSERLVSQGLYRAMLKPWYRALGSDQILVLRSEAMFSDPAEACRKSFAHLRVGSGFSVDTRVFNETRKVSRTRGTEPSPEVLTELRAFYRERNKGLSDLVGRTMAWQSQPASASQEG